jgi:hypothetical protein
LRDLLGDLAAAGRVDLHALHDVDDPFAVRLERLGIESVRATAANPGYEGTVVVGAGSYGALGMDGPGVDRWLGALLASEQGINKLDKLSRAGAAQRHLAVVIDINSQPGMGIPLALRARRLRGPVTYGMPSLVPPEPLTHLWLIPDAIATWEGLRWVRGSEWMILEGWQPTGR